MQTKSFRSALYYLPALVILLLSCSARNDHPVTEENSKPKTEKQHRAPGAGATPRSMKHLDIPLGSDLSSTNLSRFNHFGEFEAEGNLLDFYYANASGLHKYDAPVETLTLCFKNGVLTRKTFSFQNDIFENLVDHLNLTGKVKEERRYLFKKQDSYISYHKESMYILSEFIRDR